MPALPFFGSSDPEETDAWDSPEVGGFVLPGLWNVKIKGKRKIDQQEGSGTDYDTSVDKGQRAADVTLTGQIFEREQLRAWAAEVMPALWPQAGKGKADPKEFYHPMGELYRVTAIVIADIESEVTDDRVLVVKISASAWGKPKPAKVKAADKAKGAAGPDKPSPDKAAEQSPFDPEASALDQLVNALDPKRAAGTPGAQGAPSRDPSAVKP